jgi:hypothetical protein
MATIEQCAEALTRLASGLRSGGREHVPVDLPDRTLSCTIPDLDVTFSGRLHNGELVDMSTDPAPRAQIRLTTKSDDLLELTEGRLSLPSAWVSGRVKIEASFLDLIKLRSLG